MANTKSAAKRARQTAGRTLRNRSVLYSPPRNEETFRLRATPDAKEVGEFISAIDKAAKRGIIHRNTARRRKARLNKRIKPRRKSRRPNGLASGVLVVDLFFNSLRANLHCISNKRIKFMR